MNDFAVPAHPIPMPSIWHDRLRLFRASHPHKSLDVRWHTWTYLKGGCGERVALLLHGSESDAESLFGALSLLERHYTVIAPTYPDELNSLDDVCAGLAALLEHAGAPALVVGYSMGGYLAQALAERRPDLVDRLVLCNTGGPAPAALRMVRVQYSLLAATPDPLLRGALRAGAGLPLWRESPGLSTADYLFWRGYFIEMAARISKRAMLGHGRIIEQFLAGRAAPPAKLASEPGRVLILDAAYDHVIEAVERVALRAAYPLAHTRLLTTMGHLSALTQPDAFIAAIEDAFPA